MPITAVRDDDGRIMVRDGQRRTLASQKAGLDTVPVYVLPSAAATFREFEVERIVQQIVCNDQKADLTDAQRARGIQTMLDAGVSVAKVAKLISTKKAVVVAAETAGKSTEAMEALADGQLNRSQREPDQAGEFGDDRGLVVGAGHGVIGVVVGVGAVDRGVPADRCEPAGRPIEVPGDGVPRWQGPTAGPIEASQA